jgi:hypothetical protein
MPLKSTILALNPTSYWPLDDPAGSATCLDAMGLTNACLPGSGVTLAAVPFGASSAPLFDGAIGSRLTIAGAPQYSHSFLNALTVAVWICPLALDNANTAGKAGEDQYVHFLEKAVTPVLDTEWAVRLYNQTNPTRHSRLSFYMFNLRATTSNPTNKGAGSYMEFGASDNDVTPVTAGSWLFLVGEAEPWICADDQTTGCILWKQDVEAKRITQDKYEYPEFQVQPQAGPGPLSVGGTAETGFNGAIAHLAIWNRLLAQDEIDLMSVQGATDLGAAPT